MKRGCANGFMLLEVLLAGAILAITLFALINALGQCVAAARSVQNEAIVETLLANKSAEFRVDRADDILDQEGVFEELPGFSWSRRFEMTDTVGLWIQTVTIYWKERGRDFDESVTEYRYLPQKQR